MSYFAKKNRRSMACALLVAILASLVPIHEGHAEIADHGAPAVEAVEASAPLVQSSECQEITCVRTPVIFGVMCEACECIWVWVDENGNSRLGRDHWMRCGVV